MKKRRLFVIGEGATDGMLTYCGGPDVEDALDGLKWLLEGEVSNLMCGDEKASSVQLIVREMTDEEVDALPDP